jgi:tetratricopeptide (TPR) repeat protein
VYRDADARPSDIAAVGALAKTLHAWEQWGAAHDTYARAQALAPRAFEWQYLDAVVLQRLARHAEAASRLDTAVQLSPSNVPARVKLAEALLEAGNLDRSAQLFEALRAEPVAVPAAEFGLGRIAAAHGRHDQAIAHFQRAIALFPEWGAAHYALALSLRTLGRREDAQRELALHAQYGPRWPGLDDPVLASVTALRDDESTTLQRGVKLAEAGDLAGAIAAHEAALARDPSIAQAHANLISLYGRTRNWTKAEEHYRAVVALGVNLADAHNDYGGVLALQQKWDLAADAYRKAVAVNPSFRLARFNLGRMLIALGKNDEAIAELEQLKEPRDGEAPRYLFALATAYVRAGRREDGVRWATDAKNLALAHGQRELADAIERELARLR